MVKNPFQGKKIAILGLSVEGMASLEYFYSSGADFTVLDQKTEDQFDKRFINLLKVKNIKSLFGSHYLNKLDQYDIIVRTPGFPLWDRRLQNAIKKGVELTSHTGIFFQLCQGKIIGVTGTKGKGTTSTLIFKLLKASGKQAFLGGNIGIPPLSFLPKITPDSWVVLELSSFQLADLKNSPHIAVILNITSDHLYSASFENPNYHLSQKEYIEAKINLLRYQKESDYVILNRDYQSSYSLQKYTKADLWLFSKNRKVAKGSYVDGKGIFLNTGSLDKKLCDVSDIQLRGVHNLENITAAITGAYLSGVDHPVIIPVVTKFKGLEHRLEYVGKVRGVKFYNDSFSTTPDTAIAAIRSFTEPIVLICGGSEKGSNYSDLGKEIIKANIRKVILIGRTAAMIKLSIIQAAQRLNKSLPSIASGPATMTEIASLAYSFAKKGDIVLLSPASASFDMFKNYKERGLLFKKAVKNLA